MTGDARARTCIARRIGAGALLVSCLSMPGSASAQGEGPGGPAERTAPDERTLEERVEELERAKAESEETRRKNEQLERRVEELELEKAAHEDATRSIILQTFQTLGSKINEYVSLGGVIEVLTRSQEDFYGKDEESIRLNTAELQFEIQATDWARGNLNVEYDDGQDVVFTTVEDDEFSVDRINIDTAEIYVGNTEQFWGYGRFGRMVLPFGISTGDPVFDVLTLSDPLTVEAFETRDDALLIGIEFPTPPLKPETVAAAPPRVRPLVLNPLVRKLARLVGYEPLPTPPPPPTYYIPAPDLPPFTAAIYFYHGDTFQKGKPNRRGEWDPVKHFGASVGYRTRGTCHSHLEDPEATDPLRWLRVLCPWAIDVDVDYNRSVYDSNFLAFEYRSSGNVFIPGRDFIEQIGIVSGMAAHVKASLGPVGLVAEWNGAISDVSFFDDTIIFPGPDDALIRMKPSTWEVSLAYQFDWNPSVETIGAQGTYVAVGYSESRDLAGVTRVNDQTGEATRVGFVPKRRFVVDVGEWVHENLRVALEYSYEHDYDGNQAGVRFSPLGATQDRSANVTGGTGKSAHGFNAMLTFDW